MKSKIHCRSQKELANYLEELTTYFNDYGLIPEENGYVALPVDGILRIRFDQKNNQSSVLITLDWYVEGGTSNVQF